MLTGRQQEIWDFLVDYVDRHGYPPTVREIGEAVGLASPSTVHAHLANLERAGLLQRDPTKPRALELVGRRARRERRAGARRRTSCRSRPDRRRRAAARRAERRGVPRGARAALARRRRFLLRVKGESMIDAGHPRRRHRRRAARAGRAQRRDRRRARRRRRVGRRGDGQALLPRERPRPAPARERRARADLRAARPDPRQGDGGVPERCERSRRSTGRSTRSSSRCSAAPASSASSAASSCCTSAADDRVPRVRLAACARRPTRLEARLQFDAQAG